jgi:8-oxo-dGTP diphosphatase
MAVHDGNGWVECTCGARHWGRHGAAGLLLVRPGGGHPPGAGSDDVEVLLQLRAEWTHEGGRWGVPGGARDSHEDDVAAALREADEEAGVLPSAVRVLGSHTGVDHGAWRYTYVVACCDEAVDVERRTPESDDLRWVLLDHVMTLPLHSGLAAAWPRLIHLLTSTVLH